ncbi:MAG: type I-PGING CRISPR-associated protein Cas5p [Mangrovibacterium sp.]
MKNLDLSILKKIPEPNLRVILEIEPLAPLSMVSELPGSFYKSLKSPSKKMICGLFENILGWHIDIADRKLIQKDLIKARQKGVKESDMKKGIKADIESFQSGSTYIPLLYEYFDVGLPVIPATISYNDLWSRSFARTDTARHAAGAKFMDASLIGKWTQIKKSVASNEKRSSPQKTKLLDNLFKRYIGSFPMYYTTPTTREYFSYSGSIKISLSIDNILKEQLSKALLYSNMAYLGSNEGWINLKIYTL